MVSTQALSTALLLVLTSLPLPVRADTLPIPGTGACTAVMRELAVAFNQTRPAREVIIPPSVGSRGGIRAVIEGESRLARVARPLTADERKAGLRYRAFARDAVVFVAGVRVRVPELATRQLAEIFSGEVDNWRLVGGDDAPIRVLIREPTDSSLTLIRKHLTAFTDLRFTEAAKMAFRDYEMIDLLDKYPTSIGFVTRSSITSAKTALRLLGIDSVMPDRDHISSGAYPLIIEYALVYKQGHLDEGSRAFMDFVFSGTGQRLLETHELLALGAR